MTVHPTLDTVSQRSFSANLLKALTPSFRGKKKGGASRDERELSRRDMPMCSIPYTSGRSLTLDDSPIGRL